MSQFARFGSAALTGYYRLLQFLLTLCMTAMIAAVTLQILSRFTGLVPRYVWTEEAARFCFVWIIMLGSAVAVRDGSHFDVDLLPHPKTDRAKGYYQLVVHLAMLVLALLFVRYGYDFAEFGSRQKSEMSAINMLGIFIAFPLAGVSWTLFLLEHIARDLRLISGPAPGEAA